MAMTPLLLYQRLCADNDRPGEPWSRFITGSLIKLTDPEASVVDDGIYLVSADGVEQVAHLNDMIKLGRG